MLPVAARLVTCSAFLFTFRAGPEEFKAARATYEYYSSLLSPFASAVAFKTHEKKGKKTRFAQRD